jgi:hypothetical protein
VELPLKVPGVLQKHLNDPNAANIALNEMPDYPAIEAVATELNVDFDWVVEQVDALRPKANRGIFVEELLKGDPLAESELPNIADYMLRGWATQCGVTVDFLKERCKAVHKKREAKKEEARLKAEAEAKAKAAAEASAKARAAKGDAKPPEDKKKPAVDEDLKRQIGGQVVGLAADDDQMWQLINDVPDFAALRKVADTFHVDVTVVMDVAEQYFPHHTGGSLRLDDCLGKMKEEQVRGLHEGTLDPGIISKFEAGLVKATGLPLEFIKARIGPWIDANWG